MELTPELELKLTRLVKDQERIRIGFEIIESLESMIFYRGTDANNPRIQILVKLQQMSKSVLKELNDMKEE